MFNKLVFDTTDIETIQDSHSVGAYVRSGEAGALITHHSPVEAGGATFDFADGDVTVGTDIINEVAHGFFTGDVIQLTSTGTLPAGLALATDYYVIRIDADNFKLAASAIDAEQGNAVDITAAAGGGVHTVTKQESERKALDVYMINEIDINLTQSDEVTVFQGTSPWVVSATQLDIDDLTFADDKVDVSGSEVSLDAATLAALETVTVEQGTSPWVIGDGGGSITVDGEVALDAATLAALETTNSVQSGTWTVGLSEDHNYGAVGAATLRTAAQIGNATGAADFGAGNAGAQTLRVTLADDDVLTTTDAALANTAIAHAQQPAAAANTAESAVDSILADRKYLFLANAGSKDMVIGGAGVTIETGFPIAPGSYMELRAGAAVDVQWAARAVGGSDLRNLQLS